MPACHISPQDKKALIGNVGEELVKRHGKKKYYRPDEVRRASEARGYDVDVICWAYCIYTSPEDFQAIHDALGEVCDYVKMKSEVLTELSGGSFELPDINLSWLEWPDIDLSSLFDWFDI